MTTAYVYKWTHIPTLKWYVGSRTARGCHPDDGYICSSKIVKPLIKANPAEWERQIIATGSAAEMRQLEADILELFDAKNDPRSFNQNNNDANWCGAPIGHKQSNKTQEKKRLKLKNHNRGLTYEQIHGEEKGKILREKKRNQTPWNKGKTGVYSQEMLTKLSIINSKPIMTPNGEFPSLTLAANHYDIKKCSLAERMKRRPDLYYYINEKGP